MQNIQIYTSNNCSYCMNAKLLLKQKNVDFEEINVSQQPEQFKLMLERSKGLRTVPQIFINNQHIGGFNEIAKLNSIGELDKLIYD